MGSRSDGIEITASVRRRFWAKVDRLGPEDCWEWTAGKNIGGYGHLWVDGRMEQAHRVSWVIHRGEITNGLCVLHRCDNPPCVNPAHLFLGTRADNNADRDRKGRYRELSDADIAAWLAAGHAAAAIANRKISDGDVRAIRRGYAAGGVTYAELAEKYDISKTHVGCIVNWRYRVDAGGVGRLGEE